MTSESFSLSDRKKKVYGDDSVEQRPPLLHTKSDTNITRWAARNHPLRKDSPPRIIAPVSQQSPSANTTDLYDASGEQRKNIPVVVERSGSSDSARETTGGSSQDLNGQARAGGQKKHISFNTFVEQCIAIDSPPKSSSFGGRRMTSPKAYDEAYDEGSVLFLFALFGPHAH